MGDLVYHYANYSDNLDELEALVNAIGDNGRERAIAEAREKIRRVTTAKKSLGLEMRMLRDKVQRDKYESDIAKLDARFKTLEAKLAAAEANADREELLGDAAGADAGGVRQAGKTNDQYLAAANTLQDKTDASIEQTLGMIEAAKDVGTATIDELARQRDQITSIGDDVAKIEDNLTRADRLIRTFGKRMATDKCIQVFTIINLIMVVVIVVYAILTKRISLDGGGDGGKGDTPDVTSADDATDSTDSVDSSSRRFLRGWRS